MTYRARATPGWPDTRLALSLLTGQDSSLRADLPPGHGKAKAMSLDFALGCCRKRTTLGTRPAGAPGATTSRRLRDLGRPRLRAPNDFSRAGTRHVRS